jgi:hypothetical protein
VTGVSDDGWLNRDGPATLRVYGGRGGCVRVAVEVALPVLVPAGRAFRITGPATDISARVRPGVSRTVGLRACAGPRARPVRFHLFATRGQRDPRQAPPLKLMRIEERAQ